MPLIDLSHIIEENMPVYPGTEPVKISPMSEMDRDGFVEKTIVLGSHVGTHMDAPAHVLAGGKTLDQLPIDHFAGSACVLDLRGLGGPEINLQALEGRMDQGGSFEFYLLRTGWSRLWGSQGYFQGYPVLSPEAARFLAGLGPKGVGVDAISIDDLDSSELPIHRIFLSRDIVIVENLDHLEQLPNEPFKFCCFPLKFKGADGSPVRAVAEKVSDVHARMPG